MKSMDQFFENVYAFFRARRTLLFAGLLVGLAAAGAVVGLKLRPQENVAAMLPDDDSRVARDFNMLKRVYFEYNEDPEGLQAKMEAEMNRLGIERLPEAPLVQDYFGDTGLPTAPGGR